MPDLSGKTVAILATDGFEQAELFTPKEELEKAGAKTVIVSLKTGDIQGFDHLKAGQDGHRREGALGGVGRRLRRADAARRGQ